LIQGRANSLLDTVKESRVGAESVIEFDKGLNFRELVGLTVDFYCWFGRFGWGNRLGWFCRLNRFNGCSLYRLDWIGGSRGYWLDWIGFSGRRNRRIRGQSRKSTLTYPLHSSV